MTEVMMLKRSWSSSYFRSWLIFEMFEQVSQENSFSSEKEGDRQLLKRVETPPNRGVCVCVFACVYVCVC